MSMGAKARSMPGSPPREPVKVRVAHALDAVRADRSLDVATLSEWSGLPALTVSAMLGLRTTKLLPLRQVHQLARVLGVHLADVLSGKEADWGPWAASHDDVLRVRRHMEQALKAAREGASLSTRDIAREADVAHSYVVRVEGGQYEDLDLVRAERIAWACGHEVLDLLSSWG